jgi:hypothetical protein
VSNRVLRFERERGARTHVPLAVEGDELPLGRDHEPSVGERDRAHVRTAAAGVGSKADRPEANADDVVRGGQERRRAAGEEHGRSSGGGADHGRGSLLAIGGEDDEVAARGQDRDVAAPVDQRRGLDREAEVAVPGDVEGAGRERRT